MLINNPKKTSMEHISSILWLISWPVLIFVMYKLIFAAVKRNGMLYDEGEEED